MQSKPSNKCTSSENQSLHAAGKTRTDHCINLVSLFPSCRKSLHGRGLAQSARVRGLNPTFDDIAEDQPDGAVAIIHKVSSSSREKETKSKQPSTSPSRLVTAKATVLPRPQSPQKIDLQVTRTKTSRGYAQDETEVVPLRRGGDKSKSSSTKWTEV